jgi:hypothetical protein
LGIANRFLPGGDARTMRRGLDIQEQLDSRLHEAVTSMGLDAARRFNEITAQN